MPTNFPVIKLGTRQSPLAIWQVESVAAALKEHGLATEIVGISTVGDRRQSEPIYRLGIVGVFTKELDAAVLSGNIDAAIHSYKDVPTTLAEGLVVAAVLPRGSAGDVLILSEKTAFQIQKINDATPQYKTDFDNFFSEKMPQLVENQQLKIATSSLRRRAQWLSKFPNSTMRDVRGNIGTRLEKLERSDFGGVIMAKAAVERLDLWEKLVAKNQIFDLDFMLPAPAQGAVVVVCRQTDDILRGQFLKINDLETAAETAAERAFLQAMQAGCSMPMAAFGKILDNTLTLKVGVYALGGTEKFESEKQIFWNKTDKTDDIGGILAAEILENPPCRRLIEKLNDEQNFIHPNA